MGLSYPNYSSEEDPHDTWGRSPLPVMLGLVEIPLSEPLEYAFLYAQPNTGTRHGGPQGAVGYDNLGGHSPPE